MQISEFRPDLSVDDGGTNFINYTGPNTIEFAIKVSRVATNIQCEAFNPLNVIRPIIIANTSY